MCARYERTLAARALAEAIGCSLVDGAEDVAPNPEVRPTNRALILADFGSGLQLAPATWGLRTVIQGKPKSVYNARIESLDNSPLWRGVLPCWMPATGWFEWQEFPGRKTSWKKPKYRLGPASGEPFMMRAVMRREADGWHGAFVTQDPPLHIAPVHDRCPFPYPLTAARDPKAPSLLDRCTSVRLTVGDAPAYFLKASDDAVALAMKTLAH